MTLRRRLPAVLGTSLLGLAEAHSRWRVFVAERRHLAPHSLLEFESNDLTGCFDTIAQPRLFQALQFAMRLLLATANHPSISSAAATTLAAPRVLHHKQYRIYRPSSNGFMYRSAIDVCGGRLPSEHLEASSRLARSGTMHASLFVESAASSSELSRQPLSALREHVFCNIVQLHGRFFIQRMGVPQVCT
jgi:hypothetical protein